MTLKLRKKSLFPAVVTAQSPILLTKNGAAYDFSFDSDAYTAGALPEFVAAVLGSLPVDVTTIAALKLLPSGTFFAAEVRGYYGANDGGGGLFYWDGASTATDNGGTIIQPTAGGTGRWIRLVTDKVYTPKMFGAKADGTNDKTYVQNAIDAINLAGGGTLFFDSTYTVGGTKHANTFSIIDLKSGVNFDGPGGLKLADNTNVADSVFTATFAGTTMTVTGVTSGTIALNQFLSLSGNVALVKVQSFGSGTGGTGTYIVTVAPANSAGTPIAGPITVKGINRMVELAGAYNSTSNSITDTTYKNVLFDYNGANNCASGTIWSFNSVVSIQTCDGVVFQNARFRNNCGSNSIVLGTYQTTITAFRSRIENCSFQNDGDRINAVCVDYSTLFVVGSHIDIVGNTFGLGPTNNGVAWEVYGQDINITGNTVSGYYGASNVVAIANQTTKTVSIASNTVQDCSIGITLWTLAATSKLQAISIVGNTFEANVSAPGGPYLVDGINQVTNASELRDILISGNVWQNVNLSDTTRLTPGVSLKSALTAKISGNLIYGIPGPGIYITGSLEPASIDITNNSLINTGYGGLAGAATRTGITVDASGTSGSLLINGNLINPISGYTLTTGIKNALAVTAGYIQNNLIISATTPINNTGTNVTSETGSGALVRAASPTFSGTPLTTTAAVDTNTTQIASTAFVLGQAGAATPLVSNAAVVGTSTRYARADHVHPSSQIAILWSAGNLVTLSPGTFYMGTGFAAGTENVVAIPAPCAGTVKSLYASTNTGPGGATTYTVTMRKNAADQALTCQMTGAATTANDTNGAHAFTVAAGDLICAKLVVGGGAATATGFNVGFTFVPST
ncbi:beta strand repeat-containing protein [Bradyrhizobium manausense]